MKAKKIDGTASQDQLFERRRPAEKLRLLTLKDLAQTLMEELSSASEHRQLDVNRGLNFYKEVKNFEIELIQAALRQAAGKQVIAARLLNLNTTTLNSKIKSYNIQTDPPFRVVSPDHGARASNTRSGLNTHPKSEVEGAEDVPILG